MQNILDNNRAGALMTILVLAVSSISIAGTTQFVKGLDPFSAGAASSSGGGTLTIFLRVTGCGANCGIPPSEFDVKVTGNNPSFDDPFPGDPSGTTVTLGRGAYTVSEQFDNGGNLDFKEFTGDCKQDAENSKTASGSMETGDTQECIITMHEV